MLGTWKGDNSSRYCSDSNLLFVVKAKDFISHLYEKIYWGPARNSRDNEVSVLDWWVLPTKLILAYTILKDDIWPPFMGGGGRGGGESVTSVKISDTQTPRSCRWGVKKQRCDSWHTTIYKQALKWKREDPSWKRQHVLAECRWWSLLLMGQKVLVSTETKHYQSIVIWLVKILRRDMIGSSWPSCWLLVYRTAFPQK